VTAGRESPGGSAGGRPDTYDVVVVGAGNAGMMAAIQAAEAGARVAILQKLPRPGGKSSLAIGSISAAGTSLQRARGISDDDDRHWQDLKARIAAGGIEPLSMPKLELAVRHGAETIERLVTLGVQLTGPHPELPGEAWRMHVVWPDARALVRALARRADQLGITLICDWPVDSLVVDQGRVVGARGPRGITLARQSVVLASGDFSAPGRLSDVSPRGSDYAFRPWASGDGQLMARAIGAALTHLGEPLRAQLRTVDWPHIEPNPKLFPAGCILVDRTGCRVADETSQPAVSVAATAADPDLFLIGDQQVIGRIPTAAEDSAHARDAWLAGGRLYLSTFPGCGYSYVEDIRAAGYGFVASSAARLAVQLGIDVAGLECTISEYNAAIDTGSPDPFGRANLGAGVREAPLLGIGPFTIRAILGRAGVRIDNSMRVLDHNDRPIPGLTAAGAAAGVTGFAYGHGYELAWALVSGRLAGATAAT
jgi:fumarate reductase flavoprotein subunit